MVEIQKVDINQAFSEAAVARQKMDAMRTQRNDANNESLILAEALDYVESELLKPMRPQFFARNLMGVDSSGFPMQDQFKYFELRGTHDQAKWVDTWGDGSIPTVNANLREVYGPVKGFALSAVWTEDEIRKVQAANANRRSGEPAIGLENELVMEVMRGMADFENEVLLFGDEDRGIPGFMNNPDYAPAYIVPEGAGGKTNWSEKTPLEILKDLNDIAWNQYILTKQVHRPNKMVMSNSMLKLISTTPMSADNPRTILEQFLATNQFFSAANQVMSIFNFELTELAGKMPDDLFENKGLLFCYDDSMMVLKAKIPMPAQRIATFTPDQSNPFGFRAIWAERLGGCSVRMPQAVLRVSGHEADIP